MQRTADIIRFRFLPRGREAVFIVGLFLLPSSLRAFPYITSNEVTATATDQLYQGAGVAWGDADNDGDMDIVACGLSDGGNRQLFMFPGDGAGGFVGAVDVNGANGGMSRCAVQLGDMDGDGDLDIVIMGGNSANNGQFVRVHLRGAAGWSTGFSLGGGGVSTQEGGLALGDHDNDGDLDILYTGRHYQGGADPIYLRLLQNDGTGTAFTTVTPTGTAGIWNGGAAWADFNRDGLLDMLVSGADNQAQTVRRVRVYFNDGDGTWTASDMPGALGLALGDATAGDFDGDGWPDVVAMGTNDGANEQIRWWRNNQAGGFTGPNLVAAANAGLSQGRLAVADVDRDGDMDVVANGSQNAATPLIVVYTNNGAGVFTTNSTVAGDLLDGAVALGDANADGTLDLSSVGTIDGTQAGRRVRWYPSTSAVNVAPNVPTVFAAAFAFSTTGLSTAAFSWSGATDNAPGATPAALLAYDVQVSTVAGVAAPYVFSSRPHANSTGTVRLTSADPWNVQAGVPYGLRTDTTYYYRIQTVDAGLLKSGFTAAQTLWTGIAPATTTSLAAAGGPGSGQTTLTWNSAGDDATMGALTGVYRIQYSTDAGTVWNRDVTPAGAFTVDVATAAQAVGSAQSQAVSGLTVGDTYYFVMWSQDDVGLWSGISNAVSALVPSGPPPGTVADLATAAATTDGQILLTWTAPTNVDPASVYDVRWSLAAITSDALFSAATPLTGEPTPFAPGLPETLFVSGVPPEQTVFFALKTVNGSASAVSNSPSGIPLVFDRTQIEVGGAAGAGLDRGDAAWGDMDGDGLWDIVAQGIDSGGTRRLRVYRNNGAGGFEAPLEMGGLAFGNVDLGDYNGDGKPDILASGNSAAGVRQLRVHVNASVSGVLSFPATVDVPGAAGLGYDSVGTNNGGGCGLQWADINSDGDLDVVVCGDDPGGTARLHVYLNNGNGTFNPMPVTASANFYQWGDLVVADFNNDNRPDIAAMGYNTGDAVRQLAVYINVSGTSFTEAVVPGGLSSGALDAGDFDLDGWVDLLVAGFDGNRQFQAYRNNAGVFNLAPVEVPGAANLGLNRGEVAWGDYNNDGNLDALGQGSDNGAAGDGGEIHIYPGNGAGSFGAVVNVEDPDGGLVNEGAVAWGDYDQDGDVDLLISGNTQVGGGGTPQLRVYTNYYNFSTLTPPNNPPGAPALLAADFVFSSVGTSTASFKWEPATDDITPAAGLKYQVQAATTSPSYVSPLAINTPSPQYFSMTFDCGGGPDTCHGTILTSTNPWDAQSGTLTGLVTDTTYYFHVKTIDGGYMESLWSADTFLWTGVAPSSAAVSISTTAPGQIGLAWNSSGDDQTQGLLTGNYRLQYSTDAATAWTTASTPAGAYTVTLPTTSVTAGDAQSHTLTGLLEGSTHYIVLWTQDDVGLWSEISPVVSTYVPVGFRDITIVETEYAFGTLNVGVSTGSQTGINVTVSGNVNSTLRLSASTATVGGSPWSLGTAVPGPGSDTVVLYGGFNSTQPLLGDFQGDDVLLETPQVCDATVYALGESCENLAPGTTRTLWFRLDMPTDSSSAVEEQIQITVEAGP